jgi:hypothetical protein
MQRLLTKTQAVNDVTKKKSFCSGNIKKHKKIITFYGEERRFSQIWVLTTQRGKSVLKIMQNFNYNSDASIGKSNHCAKDVF